MRDNIIHIIEKKKSLSPNEIYLISSVFGFLLGLFLFIFFTPNYFKYHTPVEFEIQQGSSLTKVIDSLVDKELVPNKTMMHIAAFMYGAETKVKAGKYKIENGLSYFGMIELLLEGSVSNQKLITIPEGIWQHNLASLVSKTFNVDSSEIIRLSNDKTFLRKLGIPDNTIEGYLLPETYYLFEDSNAEEILVKLKSEMDKIFEPDSVRLQMLKMGMNKHEILTIASIIDGESNIIDEFKRISGVYHNRLKKKIALQADPTVQYLKRHKRRRNKIYYKDLEIDSPYNTYKYAGLPPGPINNPGKEAVLAALYPEEHDFYYFVADGSGGHVFAKTLSQHNRNVNNYREWRRSQK